MAGDQEADAGEEHGHLPQLPEAGRPRPDPGARRVPVRAELGPEHLAALYRAHADKPRQALYLHQTAHAALAWATKQRPPVALHNAAALVGPKPTYRPPEKRPLAGTDHARLLAEAEARSSRYAAASALLVYCGPRPSEMRALKRTDVAADWDAAVDTGRWVEAIAAVPGLDAVLVGTGDLSAPSACRGRATIHWYGRPSSTRSRRVGATASPAGRTSAAHDWAKRGATFMSCSFDGALPLAASKQVVEGARGPLGARRC